MGDFILKRQIPLERILCDTLSGLTGWIWL